MYLYQGLKVRQIKPYPLDEHFTLNTVLLDFRVMELNRNLVRLYRNISCKDGQVGELIIDVPEVSINEYFQLMD